MQEKSVHNEGIFDPAINQGTTEKDFVWNDLRSFYSFLD
jgi:hypothetical protein